MTGFKARVGHVCGLWLCLCMGCVQEPPVSVSVASQEAEAVPEVDEASTEEPPVRGPAMVAFTPNGDGLVVVRRDQRVQRWALPDGRLTWQRPAPKNPETTRWWLSSGGMLLAKQTRGAKAPDEIYDLSPMVPRASNVDLWADHYFEAGVDALVARAQHGELRMIGDQPSLRVQTIWRVDPPTIILLEPAEKVLKVSASQRADQPPQRVEVPCGGAARGVALSHFGRLFAVLCDDHSIHVYNTMQGQPLGILEGHDAAVDALVFSPGGDMIASVSVDDNVRLWRWQEDTWAAWISL